MDTLCPNFGGSASVVNIADSLTRLNFLSPADSKENKFRLKTALLTSHIPHPPPPPPPFVLIWQKQ